jgi:HAE1 family hydrophobic/amphiphilic exporter-1
VRLPDLSIDRPVAVSMVLVSLLVLGAVALVRLPLDFLPLVNEPEIDVEVPFPGSHPLEALREVALPIEEEIAAIPGVRSIESDASGGVAHIETRFDWSASVKVKQMEVREAVERARERLPASIGFIRVEGDVGGPAGGAILQGRISAERDLSESWELLDRRIRRPLERIKGVARVSLYGVEAQQVRVELDLDALKRHAIRPEQVLQAVDAANVDLDLGTIRGDVLRYDVRSVARFHDVSQIRELLLAPGGVRVGDVARVSLREPLLDYGRHLDRRFAIGIDVFKEPTANTVETVDRLMARIAEIERERELQGITLLVWVNQADEIRNSLAGLRNAGLVGGLLAAAVLYLFLRRLRTTLIVSLAIPFSIVVTFGGMYLLDYDLNVLTMLGLMLGVGMLVDNAVVVIENIHRLEGQGLPALAAARKGSRDVALAVTASTASTVIVWSWLFATERSHLTIYVGQVAFTLCLAVCASLLVSLTFIPLAAARFVPRQEVRPGFLLRRIVPAYRRLLGWTLRHRLATLVGLLALAGSAAVPIARIEKQGEPRIRERAVPILYEVHDRLTKEVLEQHVDRVEGWLESLREELAYASIYSWYSEGEGEAMTQIYLRPERATDAEVRRVREIVQPGLPSIPGVQLRVGDSGWWRHGNQGRRMVSVALHGDDPDYLQELAARVEERVQGLEGLVEVYGPSVAGQRELRLVVDPDRARSLGLTPQGVARTAAFAYRGQRLRRFQHESGEVEVLVGLPEESQPGLASLADLPVPRADGTGIPLGAVVTTSIVRTPQRVHRAERRTTTWVNVQFEDEVTTEVAQARVARRMEGFAFPEGYGWSWGEWGRDRDEGLGVMLRGVLLSLLLVVLLMAAVFESMLQPLAIVITLPLAFFGAFWSLWLGGFTLDSVAFIGIIVLIGIVVNNGIVMVDHVNALRRAGRDRVSALIEGCGDRLRPVLMTAITTIFGLLPLAFSTFTVAGAYIDSLAVAVLGGMLSSTLFTLVALPVWYTTIEDLGSLAPRLLPRRARPAGKLREVER